MLDPERYEYTFAPDPNFCRIVEYYCPGCATQVEAEYLPPGHPLTVDMIWDVASLRERWAKSGKNPEEVLNYGPGGENAIADLRAQFDQPTTRTHRN